MAIAPRLLLPTALLWAGAVSGAPAGDAPFGLAWGPLTSVPRPSMADREGNVTALFYVHGQPRRPGPTPSKSSSRSVRRRVCSRSSGSAGLSRRPRSRRPTQPSIGRGSTLRRAAGRQADASGRLADGADASGDPPRRGRRETHHHDCLGRTLREVLAGAGGRATGHPATVHTADLLEARERRIAP